MSKSNSTGLTKSEKWLLLGGIHVALSAFVYYFNVRVFGQEDAKFYAAPLVVLGVVSYIAARHIHSGEATEVFRKKAFQVELAILSVLLLNVVVSMMVLREMSLAGQAESRFDRHLGTASRLRSTDAQERLVAAIVSGKQPTKIQVFQEKEKILVGLLFLELVVAMGGGLWLVAYSLGDADKNGEIDFFEDNSEDEEELPAKGKKKTSFSGFPA